MKLTKSACVFVCALVCLFYGTTAWAQGGTGALTGLVFDPSAAVVANAKVTLTNSATGAVRSTQSSDAGVYRFVALPVVGTYTLKVEVAGFKTAVIGDIVITVASVATQDVHLELGMATQTVEVTSAAVLVQPTESAVSTLVDRRIWENMPLEVRNQNVFIEMAAGVVPDAQAGGQRGASVNGARSGTGNYLVEGTDNYEQGQGGRGGISSGPGGASTSISPDAIGEYRIITNSFAAEYGKGGGFITDTVLRSGVNQFHGSLFEYNRVQALAANDFFSNAQGLKDSRVRNQFGGSVGGPIRKDRTFFFSSVEFQRLRVGSPLHAIGTTQQFLDWVKSGSLKTWAETSTGGLCNNQTFLDNYFGDGTAGSSGMTAAPCVGAFPQSATLRPIFTHLAQVGPFPVAKSGLSSTGAGYYTTDLTYPVPVYGDVYVSNPEHLNEYRISAKVDHRLSDKDQLSAFYLNQTTNSGDPYGGGGNDIGPAYINDGRGENVGVTWTHTVTPTLLNTLKLGYLRHRSDYPPPPGTLGIPMILTAYDPITVGFGLYAGLPQFFTENQFQYQDHISYVRGKHSFKAGGEYRRTRNGSRFYNDTFGTFYPYGVEDLVTDLAFTDEADMALLGDYESGSVYYASAAVDPTTGKLPEVYRGFRANEYAFYFQDDWRVNPRLTINGGVRWEYFGPPHNFRENIDSNFYYGDPVRPIATTSTNPFFPKNDTFYAGVATATFKLRNFELWKKDLNNFSPRLGFAYDVRGNQKLVLRAGAGIMYDRVYNNVFENIRFNPPYFSDNMVGAAANGVPAGALSSPGLYTVPFSSTPLFASGYHALPNPRHMDQNMVTPYYEQFHFGIQWEFYKGYMLETEYVGTLGHKLVGYRDINTFDGRTASGLSTTRINKTIGADNYRSNDYASNYHGLQATVKKTYARGLAFNFSYTWSKAMDELSDLFNNRSGARPTDSMNPRTDYGRADFDMRHRVVGTLSYELPFFKNNRFAGGWSFNTIIALQSGVPFSPWSSSGSYDLNKDGIATDRIVYVGSGSPADSKLTSSPADGYFDTSMWKRYVCPASVNGGKWCNAPISRNSMIGPGLQNVDFNLTKKFKITERVTVTLQGNSFNLFNHTNFELPATNMTSSAFGKSTLTFGPRITQLALRVDF
jgi:hypothetical protein